MSTNPASHHRAPSSNLLDFGQSAWLDYIRRSLISSGELKRLIDNDGVMGVTSNPAIFEKAITGSTDYSDALQSLQQRKDLDAMALFEHLAIPDIQAATDVMRSVYDATKFRDGFVSLEVSPYLAHDTQATIDEARRLWKAVGRDNLMVKVPATHEGIPAIEQLLSEGININITLLFAQEMYEKVAIAYISGLEKYAASGGDLKKMASVASFFVSRIDATDRFANQDQAQNRPGRRCRPAQERARQSSHRQRQARLSDLQENLQRSALGSARRERRADAAPVCGPAPAPRTRLSATPCTSKS